MSTPTMQRHGSRASVALHELIHTTAVSRPDAAALRVRTGAVTYAELWQQVEAFGRGLVSAGVRRGDRVGVYLDKRIETVVAGFGASVAGAVVVPINPLLRPHQVGYILRDCGVALLVTSSDRLTPLIDEIAVSTTLRHVVLVGEGRAELSDGGLPTSSFESLLGATSALPESGVDADMAAIFYTSGSTGSPKGVVVSHRNLIVGAQSVSSYLQQRHDDVVLSLLPLSFDAGFSQLTTSFAVGSEVVLHNYRLPADVPRLVEAHGVTAITCVPPLWIQLTETSWAEGAGRTIRFFANTGGRMPRATLDRLRALFPGARPYLMYGLTEAFRSTYLDPAEVDRRPDSIGKAIPNAEILVVRPDGSPCDPGEPGELVHRGPLVALGYWGDAERTRQRFRPAPGQSEQPWRAAPDVAVWSGDLVVRDEEGFLYFVGRDDEMIKSSGYRISPSEIEEAAYDCGLVRDAVALGVPDERLGAQIVLVASPAEPTLEEGQLLAALRSRLPLYMVPRRIELRDELPRSPNGKFDRALIRAELS